VIAAIGASLVAASIRAAPAGWVAPTGLDPTSLYHLAQIPALVLLARAVGRGAAEDATVAAPRPV
jgi:hypothetical protein